MRYPTIEAFAAQRRTDQDDMEKTLFPYVAEAVKKFGTDSWYDDLLREVNVLYTDTYHREGGKGLPRDDEKFLADVKANLDKTEDPTDTTADRISVWLATAILNAATMEAAGTDEEFVVMEWVTMHDDNVRTAHKHTEGQQRPPGEAFDVDGVQMRYPGDPSAPIGLWINCRCSLAPTTPNEFSTVVAATLPSTGSTTSMSTQPGDIQEEPMTDPANAMGPTPFHSVLAPEGKWSGDGRQFAPGALTHRDLPLPMTWQKTSMPGHDGSVVVSKAEQIAVVDGEMRATGHFLSIPESDEVIGLIADFGRFGVSVDADDAEFDFDEQSGRVSFTRARVASASIVTIPAFAEAWIALGDAPPGFMGPDAGEGDVCDPNDPAYDEEACAAREDQKPAGPAHAGEVAAALMDMAMRVVGIEMVSEKSWDGSAARFTPEQWKASCILHTCDSLDKSCHKLPIKEPGGALSRAGVHAAAARFNQVQAPDDAKARAKAALRGAYKQLGEEPPDVLKAADSTTAFGRGPGWLTNPEDTKRIHDYWTVPGEEGYAKIAWGTPGDFDRCRVEVGSEIAENSPDKTRFLNQICAQWHHDATGFWPGNAPAERAGAETLSPEGDPAPALHLVASNGLRAPAEWFTNPELSDLTPLTITEEGRVFGHVAGWKTCHAAYKMCVAPPHSVTGYSHFLTGAVLLDNGTQIATGPITYGGGHAGRGGMRLAQEHYDNASAAVADVTCGEDQYGIWVAGWVRPGVSPELVAGLRASPPSGDWRRDRVHDHLSDSGQAMEMIGIHSVNNGGYLIPRVGVENGEQVSLVAAGMVDYDRDEDPVFHELVAAVADELSARDRRKQQMAAIAARIGD